MIGCLPMSHQIRLRGPWKYEGTHDGVVFQGTIRLPASFLEVVPKPDAESLTLIRWFGKPTGLEATTQLTLVVTGDLQPKVVCLNTVELSDRQPKTSTETRWSMTGRLEPRNELRLEFAPTTQEADSTSVTFPEIALEIVE